MEKPLLNIAVLAADDSPLNLMIITQVLNNAGARVITAIDGKQVLEKLEEEKVDIILMDLQMPELDGFETTMVIRHCGQLYSNIPIIAVTAETDSAEIEKTVQAGMNGFISKPFVPQIIYEKILSLLQTIQNENTVSENKIKNNQPSFDLTYLKEITDGDNKNLAIIIDNLVENAPLLLKQSVEAIQLEAWKDASSYLHKLKGLVSLFFMPQITDALLIAEKETKSTFPNKISISNQIIFIDTNLPVIINLILNNLKNNG